MTTDDPAVFLAVVAAVGVIVVAGTAFTVAATVLRIVKTSQNRG